MPRAIVHVILGLLAVPSLVAAADVPVLENGKAALQIVADARGSTAEGAAVLKDAGDWLAECLEAASGAQFPVSGTLEEGPSLIIARASSWPEVARRAGLTSTRYDDYAIATDPEQGRVYVIGNSEAAARHGVADLLRRWGFRWFAPSAKWRVIPRFQDLAIHLNTVESPPLIERRIWYAYGMSGDDLRPLLDDYQRWAVANRLTLRGITATGHSYGNIIGRNKEAFEGNPLLSALLPDGSRDTRRSPNARKFCFSNPDLVNLVALDRQRLLQTSRLANPDAFMVSVDPSDGEGTCDCEDCRELGTTTDRVFHLANQVARHLKRDDPRAWVGLYAYSSHRLPPTIDVEPNVYVQVAMGFNRTEFSLPELVDRWSKKVTAIGLREYYGVEAWDWGLPGRARGGRVAYHAKWIPFYADRHLNGINAETNANWGAQALGLYVASQLMWNPRADVDALVAEFHEQLFGEAAEPMRGFHEKMEAAPPLRPATLLPLFDDLKTAWSRTDDPAVQARLVDLMAYLVYVAEFRRFDIVRSRNPEHGEAYYERVKSLMNFAWRIRQRDVVHYYALARRLCNAAPLQDNRPEFSIANKQGQPVWQFGDAYTDAEIATRFEEEYASLKADDDPTVHYSRYFDPVKVPGADAGPSHIHATPQDDESPRDNQVAVSRFRQGLLGYLIPSGSMTAKLGIAPTSKPVTLTVLKRDDIIFEQEYRAAEGFHDVAIELPGAFEYHVQITGDFELQVPAATPLVFESSVSRPAWISYSGPHYFYVPKGTTELIVDAEPRLSVVIPGIGRRDLHPADRQPGTSHIVLKVPDGADGQLWHTTTLTRGQVMLLNTPPLFSFHRGTVFVPRELSESEGLSTQP